MKNNKRFSFGAAAVAFLLIFALLGNTVIYAEEPAVVDEGECGESAFWKLDDEGTLTIYGSGKMKYYSYSGVELSPWAGNKSVKNVLIADGITSIGSSAFYRCSSLISITIPEGVTSIGYYAFCGCSSLTSIHIPEGVTSIENCAFDGCSALISIHIPEGVTSIGYYALRDCSLLTSINIPESVTSIRYDAFYGCDSLTAINIPEGVTAIESETFYGCSSLTSINIPEGVTTIGYYAFCGCSSLTSINIPESVTSIGNKAFSGCNLSEITVSENNKCYDSRNNCNAIIRSSDNALICGSNQTVVPDEITSIEDAAFSGRRSLTSLNIPEGVTSIGDSAFSGCGSLTSINIPEGVSSISSHAFSHCNSLTSFHIPKGVTSLENYAFYECSSLTSINIPEGVTSIGNYAFEGCSSLTSINIPEGITAIGNYAFEGCSSLTSINIPEGITSIGDDAFNGCSALSSINIPEGVTSIGDSAFRGCNSLSSINIPEGVTAIGKYAFEGCNSLSSINIPEGVTSIGDGAFYGCSALISINIPEGVTSIGDSTFRGCGSLTSIHLPAGVTAIGKYAFEGCNSLTSIHIPAGVTSIGKCAFKGCSSLSSVIIPDGVVSIGDSAFRFCTKLENVYVPNSVNTVGSYAFQSVKSVVYSGTAAGAPWGAEKLNGYTADGIFTYLDETKTTIVRCDANYVGTVTIPNSVTKIYDYAFTNCQKITGIVCSASLTDVGYNALYNSSIYHDESNWENDVLYCGGIAWAVRGNAATYNIKEGTKIISERAFENRSNIFTVSLPSSLNYIGQKAFSGCTGLKNPTLPSTIKSVGAEAFKNVNNVNYGGSLSTADWGALNYNGITDGIFTYSDSKQKTLIDCSADASGKVVVPNTVTSISAFAFYGCDKITEISLPFVGKSREAEGAEASFGYIFGYQDNNEANAFVPASVKKVVITDTDTIADGAFKGCDGIEEMVLPFVGKNADATGREGVFGYIFGTSDEAAEGYTEQRYSDSESVFCCVPSSLKKITVTEDRTIPYGAFYGLNHVDSITLHESTESIGKNSVYGTAIYNNFSNWDNRMLTLNSSKFIVAYDETKGQPFDGKIPTETILISDYCFEDTAFSSVELNPALVYIGRGAFKNCLSLKKVTGAEKLEYLGEEAFSGCLLLDSFEMPSSVKKIPASAFNTPTKIIYDSDKANWKKLNVTFDNATVYYTLRSEDGNAIVIYCDDDVRFDAGNVEVKKVTANTVEQADSLIFNFDSPSGFYEYRDAVPYGIFDIKLFNTNDKEIQPKSGRKVTLKIKATDGFKDMLLGSLDNFHGEFEDILIINGNIYYSSESKTPECTTDEVITDEFLRLVHFYSERFEGAKYCSYDINNVTLEDGYIVLDVPHFSEFSIVGKSRKIETESQSIVVGDSVIFDSGNVDITKYTFSVDGIVALQNSSYYGTNEGEVTVTAWNGKNAVKTFVITVMPCTCGILKYQKERTVDYKTSMKFHYEGNKPENAKVVWYINGEKYGEGEEITVSTPKDNFNVEVRVITGSDTICSETEKVIVKHGFFDKLMWFFKNLFSKTEAFIDQK